MLELTSLNKAINSLERSIGAADRIIKNGADSDGVETVKAGVVQNFEFTYELCWKFIKRWLEQNYSETFTVGLTRKQLFRYAAENLLITDFENWVEYHELRNKTSHTYDPQIANEIFEAAGGFLQEAKILLKAIEERND